jgi:type IV secretory pathway VirB9-like protein
MKSALIFVMTAPLFIVAALTADAQTAKDVTLQRLGEGDLPVIHAQKGFSTLIEFPADQKIIDVTCGDKEFWVVEGGGRYLHIKPAKEGVVTNLNVVMEGDIVYAFVLRETSRTGGATESADLHVTVKPSEDTSKLGRKLVPSVKDAEQPKAVPVSSPHAPTEANEKPQVQGEKNEAHEQAVHEPVPH